MVISGGTFGDARPYDVKHEWSTSAVSLSILAALIFLFFVWFSWIGFLQSDDLAYAGAAQDWVQQGPNLGVTHWSLRYAIVLPLALCFKLLGINEFALNVPAILYLAGLCWLTHFCVERVSGKMAALLSVLLLLSIPMVSRGASFLTTDIPEAVLLLGSLVTFHYAGQGIHRWKYVLSGILLGLAAITRETAVCLGLFYLALFAIDYKGDRAAYFWMAAGFLLIFVPDTLIHWIASGDPLYRVHVSFQVGVKDTNSGLVANNSLTHGFDSEGVMAAPRWIKPILMLFFNQQIGPVMWLGVPCAVGIIRAARVHPELALPRLLALFGLLWFVFTAYVMYLYLYLTPRYEIVTVAASVICIGAYMAYLRPTGRLAFALASLGVVLAGVFFIAVSDRNPLFAERQLASIVQGLPKDVHVWTDPATKDATGWLLARSGDERRLIGGLPPPDGLYVFSSRGRRPLPPEWSITKPPPDWTVLAKYEEADRPLVVALRKLAIWEKIPSVIANKLAPEPRTVVLLRRP